MLLVDMTSSNIPEAIGHLPEEAELAPMTIQSTQSTRNQHTHTSMYNNQYSNAILDSQFGRSRNGF